MPQAGTITINHCIIELERTISTRRIHYTKEVAKKRMSPYTKESRMAVMETLLRLCRKAAIENTDLLTELKQLK